MTKKEKTYIIDCCLDEVDAAKELMKIARKNKQPIGCYQTWINKARAKIKEMQNGKKT